MEIIEKATFKVVKVTLQQMKEHCIIATTFTFIRGEFINDMHPWYDLEDVCDDLYMDNCHFWEDSLLMICILGMI